MNKIVLKDGTELQNGIISKVTDNQIYVKIEGMSLAKVFSMFNNPKKTEYMEYSNDIYLYKFQGFTTITSIGVDRNENVEVYMTGENISMHIKNLIPKEYLPKEMWVDDEGAENNE